MNLAKDIMQYLRRPFFTTIRDPLNRESVMALVKLMGLKFIIVLAGYIVAGFILSATGLETPESDITQKLSPSIKLVILIALVAPLIEEIIFRSWLGRSWGLLIGAPMFIFFLFGFVTKRLPPEVGFGLSFVTMIFTGLCFMAFIHARRQGEALGHFAQTMFPFAFWLSILSFALVHITNYSENSLGAMSVLLVWPQFVSGIVYGYVRMRFGFFAGVGCHGAWNGTLTLIIFALMSLESFA